MSEKNMLPTYDWKVFKTFDRRFSEIFFTLFHDFFLQMWKNLEDLLRAAFYRKSYQRQRLFQNVRFGIQFRADTVLFVEF